MLRVVYGLYILAVTCGLVNIFIHILGTFEAACKKAEVAEYTSHIDSDDEETSVKRRVNRPRRFVEDSDDEDRLRSPKKKKKLSYNEEAPSKTASAGTFIFGT